jgi:hypothetical protein
LRVRSEITGSAGRWPCRGLCHGSGCAVGARGGAAEPLLLLRSAL